MSSVSSVNPGVANLLQTLSNIDSPVLSSQAAVSALENAPAGDIVKLSAAATQLAGMDAIFGIADGETAGAGSAFASLAGIPTVAGSTAASAGDAADSLFDLAG
jgi:hypothetical protein